MTKPIQRKQPQGSGRKGGTRFPNYSLKLLLPHLKELTSKTHSKPINIEQLNAGVFKIRPKSPEGGVRYSSLKQFGLADGEYSAIKSKELASKIELATGEEKITFIRDAFFNVPSFKNTFETYQNSTISKSKIKGYCVSTLKVHPDLSDKYLKSLLESAELAQLCSIANDDVTFINGKEIATRELISKVISSDRLSEDNSDDEFEDNDAKIDADNIENEVNEVEEANEKTNDANRKARKVANAATIGLQIDSSLDPDKLAKHLKLLRQYGLI